MGNGDSFRDRMIEAMTRLGINPAELARRSGVKKGIIYDLISGKQMTTAAENARPIARELGFSLDTYVPAERSAVAEELGLIFSGLPEEYRDLLMSQARALQRAAETREPPPAGPGSTDDQDPQG